MCSPQPAPIFEPVSDQDLDEFEANFRELLGQLHRQVIAEYRRSASQQPSGIRGRSDDAQSGGSFMIEALLSGASSQSPDLALIQKATAKDAMKDSAADDVDQLLRSLRKTPVDEEAAPQVRHHGRGRGEGGSQQPHSPRMGKPDAREDDAARAAPGRIQPSGGEELNVPVPPPAHRRNDERAESVQGTLTGRSEGRQSEILSVKMTHFSDTAAMQNGDQDYDRENDCDVEHHSTTQTDLQADDFSDDWPTGSQGSADATHRTLRREQTFSILPQWQSRHAQQLARGLKSGMSQTGRSSQRLSSKMAARRTRSDASEAEDTRLNLAIAPNSIVRQIWDILCVIVICHDFVWVPMFLFFRPDVPAHMYGLAVMMPIFWLLDIVLTFFTGYMSLDLQGMTVLALDQIAKRYFRSWLVLDSVLTLCVIVEGSFILAGATATPAWSILRWLMLLKLLRPCKKRNIVSHVMGLIRSEGAQILTYILGLLTALLVLCHFISCMWYAIIDGEITSGNTLGAKYLESFHFIFALFMGEHLEVRYDVWARLFVVFVLIFAFVVSASFVGSLTTAMTRLQIIASQRSAQIAALNRYLHDCAISEELSIRVMRNATHALNVRKRQDEGEIELLRLISEPLRAAIHFEVLAPHLLKHPFFHIYNRHYNEGLRRICHQSIRELPLSNGDILFSESETASIPQMFFLKFGKLHYKQGMLTTSIKNKSVWISEASLWTAWEHPGTLQGMTECQLLVLEGRKFQQVTAGFPLQFPLVYAKHFLSHMTGLRESGKLTDIGDEQACREHVLQAFEEMEEGWMPPAEWVRKDHKENRREGTTLHIHEAGLHQLRELHTQSSRRAIVRDVLSSWWRRLNGEE